MKMADSIVFLFLSSTPLLLKCANSNSISVLTSVTLGRPREPAPCRLSYETSCGSFSLTYALTGDTKKECGEVP